MDPNALTSEQRDTLNNFMDVTEYYEVANSIKLLEDNRWDIERAIGAFFTEAARNALNGEESQEEALAGNNSNDDVPMGDNFGYNEIQDIPDDDFGEANFPRPRVESLMSIETQPIPQKLRRFVENFEARYAPNHPELVMPTFYTDTLENAVNIAFSHENENFRRPLVLFINNEFSNMTENFVRNLLCNQFVVDLLREKFILFPWDITEDFNMIQLLQILTTANMRVIHEDLQNYVFSGNAHFPLLMVVNRKRYTFETIAKFDGRSDLNDVANGLHDAYEQFRNDQLVEISRDMQLRREREILNEQNIAYQESLATDMKRIASEKNLKAQEAEEKRKEELERKKAEEEESRRVEYYLEKLSSEPEESDPNHITIRFRLPGGLINTRRFLNSDIIQTLVDYLGSKGFFPENCNFFNSEYPRKDIQKFDMEKTFAEMKWPKKETVLVERTD